ncbi:MAG: hypothetical protein L0216_05765, partial [Planctomycetales bacterium]|nr:hypothetical protein [Planctomycetales bacterium]
MPRSMTGFGRAESRGARERCEVEVRSVNGKGLSVAWRAPEALVGGAVEAEKLVRDAISRGSVTVSVRFESEEIRPDYRVDEGLLARYRDAFRRAGRRLGLAGEVPLAALVALPGVVRAPEGPPAVGAAAWSRVRRTVGKALAAHARARARE